LLVEAVKDTELWAFWWVVAETAVGAFGVVAGVGDTVALWVLVPIAFVAVTVQL
jgi:hypothetical protein